MKIKDKKFVTEQTNSIVCLGHQINEVYCEKGYDSKEQKLTQMSNVLEMFNDILVPIEMLCSIFGLHKSEDSVFMLHSQAMRREINEVLDKMRKGKAK